MRRLSVHVLLALAGALNASAQFGGGARDWVTTGSDAQRSSWVRSDPKISKEAMQKPGFKFLWSVKAGKSSGTPLGEAILLDRYIGYRGFRTLGFVGGGANELYVIDTDLARIEWHKQFPSASQETGASGCRASVMAITRPAIAALPAQAGGGGGGFGRGGPARSAVGEPDQGAVTLTLARNAPPRLPPAAAPPAAGNRPPGTPAPGPGGFARTPSLLYALTTDGMLHGMYVSNGEEPKPPVRFLPANANAQGLIVIDNVAYVTTSQSCGGVPNAVWALDLASSEIASWKADGGIAGSAGPAFGPDGTVYVSTRNAGVAALEPKTLKVKGSYGGGSEFASSPVVFEYKQSVLVAALSKDGRIHLLGGKEAEPVAKTAVFFNATDDHGAGALASWQDAGGTRWLLAPVVGTIQSSAGFPAANGDVKHGAVVAWKVVDHAGAPLLEPGWVSRDVVAPLPPLVVNGVVFAGSSGGQAGQHSSPAVLYALDGTTGKELWNSGNNITSFVRGGGLSAGGSQVYLGTADGTLYAFGFFIEH